MYSAYKLNKQHANIKPCHTPFPIIKQSVVQTLVMLLLDLHTGFLGERSSSLVLPSVYEFSVFVVIHAVRGLSLVNDTEVDVFMEFPCFPHDLRDAGSLISG